MQRARCYLIGETAVVLELEPPVTLASQKRIWRLAQRLVDMPNVVEAIPGMNNITVILRNPESLALDAIERAMALLEEAEQTCEELYVQTCDEENAPKLRLYPINRKREKEQ